MNEADKKFTAEDRSAIAPILDLDTTSHTADLFLRSKRVKRKIGRSSLEPLRNKDNAPQECIEDYCYSGFFSSFEKNNPDQFEHSINRLDALQNQKYGGIYMFKVFTLFKNNLLSLLETSDNPDFKQSLPAIENLTIRDALYHARRKTDNYYYEMKTTPEDPDSIKKYNRWLTLSKIAVYASIQDSKSKPFRTNKVTP